MKIPDIILLYTDAERAEFIGRGFTSKRVFAANNAVGTAEIDRAKEQWPEFSLEIFRAANELTDRDVILFCGRITEKSDLALVLEALDGICRKRSDVLLVVIGEGERLDAMKQLAIALGVNRNIKWIGVLTEEVRLAPWFLSAKCLVYPGSIGLSLIHAFSYGLPVITHDNRQLHNPEIAALENGVNGLVFARGSSSDLAQKIEFLLDHPEMAGEMGLKALQTVKEVYCTNRMVEGFMGAVSAAHANAMARLRGV